VFRSSTFCGCWSLLRKALLRNRKTSVTCYVMRNAKTTCRKNRYCNL